MLFVLTVGVWEVASRLKAVLNDALGKVCVSVWSLVPQQTLFAVGIRMFMNILHWDNNSIRLFFPPFLLLLLPFGLYASRQSH